MGENAITTLFNRAVLDLAAGGTLLILMLFGLGRPLGLDVDAWDEWGLARFIPWILVLAVFLLGSLADRIASVVVDDKLFRSEFQTRASNFEMPDWCKSQIESGLRGVHLDPTPTESASLIDDSRVDWISSTFITHARPEALAKRSDLIANYQFASNMMLVSLAALVLVPLGFFARSHVILGVAVCPVILGLAWFLRLAGRRALMRIHTFENQVVYGLLLPKPSNARP